MPRKYERGGAGKYVQAERHVTPSEKAARFAERDAREASDSRTEAQRLVGDPPADRSALVTRKPQR
jgi:hypothetical protein